MTLPGLTYYPNTPSNAAFLFLPVSQEIQDTPSDFAVYISVDASDFVEYDITRAEAGVIDFSGVGIQELLDSVSYLNHIDVFVAPAIQGATNGTDTYTAPPSLAPSNAVGRWKFYGRNELQVVGAEGIFAQLTESVSAYDLSDNMNSLHSTGLRFDPDSDIIWLDVESLSTPLELLAGQTDVIEGFSVYIAVDDLEFVEYGFTVTQETDFYRLTITSADNNDHIKTATHDTEVNVVLTSSHTLPLSEKREQVRHNSLIGEPPENPLDDLALYLIPVETYNPGSLRFVRGGWVFNTAEISRTDPNNDIEIVKFVDSELAQDQSGNDSHLSIKGVEYISPASTSIVAGQVTVAAGSLSTPEFNLYNISLYVSIDNGDFKEFTTTAVLHGASSTFTGLGAGYIDEINSVAGTSHDLILVVADAGQDGTPAKPAGYNTPVFIREGEIARGFPPLFSNNPALILLDYLTDRFVWCKYERIRYGS